MASACLPLTGAILGWSPSKRNQKENETECDRRPNELFEKFNQHVMALQQKFDADAKAREKKWDEDARARAKKLEEDARERHKKLDEDARERHKKLEERIVELTEDARERHKKLEERIVELTEDARERDKKVSELTNGMVYAKQGSTALNIRNFYAYLASVFVDPTQGLRARGMKFRAWASKLQQDIPITVEDVFGSREIVATTATMQAVAPVLYLRRILFERFIHISTVKDFAIAINDMPDSLQAKCGNTSVMYPTKDQCKELFKLLFWDCSVEYVLTCSAVDEPWTTLPIVLPAHQQDGSGNHQPGAYAGYPGGLGYQHQQSHQPGACAGYPGGSGFQHQQSVTWQLGYETGIPGAGVHVPGATGDVLAVGGSYREETEPPPPGVPVPVRGQGGKVQGPEKCREKFYRPY